MPSVINRCAMNLAHPIHYKDQALLPSRAKVRACCVCQVMVDVPHSAYRIPIEIAINLSDSRLAREDFSVKLGGDWVKRIRSTIRCIIEIVSDLVDVSKREASFGKTIGDGADRKVTSVFVPIKSFLSRSGDQCAINEKRSC